MGGGWWVVGGELWVRVTPNARGEGTACLAITMGHSDDRERAGMVSIVGMAVFDIVQPNGKIGVSHHSRGGRMFAR